MNRIINVFWIFLRKAMLLIFLSLEKIIEMKKWVNSENNVLIFFHIWTLDCYTSIQTPHYLRSFFTWIEMRMLCFKNYGCNYFYSLGQHIMNVSAIQSLLVFWFHILNLSIDVYILCLQKGGYCNEGSAHGVF